MTQRLKNEAGLRVVLFVKSYCFLAPQMTQRFKKEAGLRVALLSVTAAGTGLDFSAASLVVFAELPSEVCQNDFEEALAAAFVLKASLTCSLANMHTCT